MSGENKTMNATKSADKVIYGTIYIGDEDGTVAEAIAINGANIVYVGSRDEAERYVGDCTEVTELDDGKFVMAGFVDGHTHIASFVAGLKSACMLPDGKGADEYVQLIREFVEAHPANQYYMAKGWITGAFGDKGPTKELLDDISTDKPIFAQSGDGHSAWANSRLIELAGITAETADPTGGRIERNADGTPSGCFRDTAIDIVRNAIPKGDAESKKEGILEAQKLYADLGYTEYFEAIANDSTMPSLYPLIEAYEELDQAGKLPLYAQGAFLVNNTDDALELVDTAIRLKEETAGGNFELTCVKIFMDGIIESSSAWLMEPYANDPDNCGAARWSTEEDLKKLTQIIIKANKGGMPVHFHTMGDAAVKTAVDCVERAYKEAGDVVLESRNAMTHLALLREEDYKRFADLNIVAVVNPWTSKDPANFVEKEELMYLGEERMNRQYPVKAFLDAGVMTAFGTDYGASFVFEPVNCYRVLVTRTTADMDPAHILYAGQQLTPDEAIRAMTAGGAYQLFREDTYGTLEAGRKASLIVLSKNLLKIENKDIPGTVVERTMSNGAWVK